jgi:molybdenum-dependent DNA-binding transcriptional regulator ModE
LKRGIEEDLMDSTKFLVSLIKEKYGSIRQFAIALDIPYSTIKSGLNAGVGGMAVDTVIKMCDALGIKVEELKGYPDTGNAMTAKEKALLDKYNRVKNSNDPKDKAVADAIDRLLGISESE